MMISLKNVPETIRAASRRNLHFKLTTGHDESTRIEPGQIWSTYSSFQVGDKEFETDAPRLVVIVSVAVDDSLIVVPISMRVDMATDIDLIVSANESDLAFRFMIEVWNEANVQHNQLRQLLGSLSEMAFHILKQLYRLRLTGDAVPSNLQEWIGLPLFGDEDARRSFQQQEIQALDYLAKPSIVDVIENETETAEKSWSFTFEVMPIFDRISNVLGPKVAFASGISGEAPTTLLYDKADRFLFEIVHRKRKAPYSIQAHTIKLSPELENRLCQITLEFSDYMMQSEPSELHTDRSIPLGEDRDFDPQRIIGVRIEIE